MASYAQSIARCQGHASMITCLGNVGSFKLTSVRIVPVDGRVPQAFRIRRCVHFVLSIGCKPLICWQAKAAMNQIR